MSRVDLHRMNMTELWEFDSRTSTIEKWTSAAGLRQDDPRDDREISQQQRSASGRLWRRPSSKGVHLDPPASLHVDGTPSSLFFMRPQKTRDEVEREESVRRFEEKMNASRLCEERQKRAVRTAGDRAVSFTGQKQLHQQTKTPSRPPHSPPHSPGENQGRLATSSACVLM